MVRTFHDSTSLDIPFSVLCPVYFLRYPNALANHVLSVDVLSREIVKRPLIDQQGPEDAGPSSPHRPSTGWGFRGSEERDEGRYVLKTSRLILKRGTLPKWAPAGIIRNTESWVLEETEVDLDGVEGKEREMRCWTRNLNHASVMAVTERNTFREASDRATSGAEQGVARGFEAHKTLLNSTYDIESDVGFSLLGNRIEKFGYNRVVTHVETSRQGILLTYARFVKDRKLPGLAPLLRQDEGGLHGADDGQVGLPSKKQRLVAALRPPFLDGDFVGPIERLRRRGRDVRTWWKSLVRGGSADREYMWIRKTSQEELDAQGERHLTPMERLRKRFLLLRDGPRLAAPSAADAKE